MTPDTTIYMIAGFTVILGGIAIYVFSLYLRYRKVEKLKAALKDLEENS
jgi:hypothetical protein